MNEQQIKKIKSLLLQFAESRNINGTTFCPSEVARAFNPESWRNDMDLVRKVADQLITEDILVVCQQGEIKNVLASAAKGPIRLKKKN